MKATVYKPKTVLLGSRDQMCINTTVNQFTGTTLNAKCKSLREGKLNGNSCQYYKNTNGKKNPKNIGWDIMDIEDLHKKSNELVICPYYLQKFRLSEADIVFMPYNYLLDSKIRAQFSLNFEQSIIIFDEAHNIERVCEEISSFEITVPILSESLYELSSIGRKVSVPGNNSDWSPEDVNLIKNFTVSFKEILENFNPESYPSSGKFFLWIIINLEVINDEITILPGSVIFDLSLEKINRVEDSKEARRHLKELYKAFENIQGEI